MSKQDKQGVRSPTEHERKYDHAAIEIVKKAVKNHEEGINKTNQILEDFVKSTLGSLEEMQSQIDGSIETHFYSGVPTLENEPASKWTTDEEKQKHLRDLYYDKDTGRAYRFVFDEEIYGWFEIEDNDMAQVLAIANAAKDTADSKRRIFVTTPVPPYDNGDLWLNNQEIFVCQISKPEGEAYADDDFVPATKYTDNTYAIQVGDNLEILRGTVAKIQEGVDSFKIEFETTVKSIDDIQQETIEQIKKTAYQFGTEDLEISKSGSEMKTHISEDGMKIKKDGQDVLVANNKGVDALDLHAKTYLIIGNNSRFEDYGENRTGCFWIGS